MFKLFGKKKLEKQIKKSVQDFNAVWNTDLDAIWSINDKNKIITAMDGWLCRKCDYGNSIEKLSDTEKIFYFSIQLQSEVDNGGFAQFFYNSSGDFACEIENSLSAIGAEQTEKIYSKALLALGGELPRNQNEREKLLDRILTDDVCEILNECDAEFYQYPDNLEELIYQFMIINKGHFT